jgi:hypothetical protein
MPTLPDPKRDHILLSKCMIHGVVTDADNDYGGGNHKTEHILKKYNSIHLGIPI